jgi:hypothetical protein
MSQLLVCLLTLLFSLSSPAMERNADFWRSSLAAESTVPATLYHYTSEAGAAGIMEKGLLPGASGKVFTTTAGDLSPLQAQVELALLPNRGLI